MAPKIKVTKEDIIKTTISLVREQGTDSINARAIALARNCSTQPIFSNFDSMEELQEKTILAAYSIYLDFINKEIQSEKYPKYKSFGMAYIRFAKEEKELFKLLFMRDRTQEELGLSPDFEESVQIIMKANNLTYTKARLLHFEMWSCVHGIAVMLATSFLPMEWDLISDVLTDVYQGVLAKHLAEDNV